MAARPKTTGVKTPAPRVTRRDMPSNDPDRLYRFEGDNPRFNIPAPSTYMPPMLPFDPNVGQPPKESFGGVLPESLLPPDPVGIGNTLMPPDPYTSPYFNDPYSYLPNEPEPFAPAYGRYQSPDNRPAGRTRGPNRSGGNNPMNNVGNVNRVPTAARIPVAPPPGYRPGIDPEWNYFPNLNPPATTMGQYPYGITPPANLPNFGNALAGLEGIGFSDFDVPELDLSNLDLSGLGFSQPSTPPVQQPATPEIAQPTIDWSNSLMPEIDYDLLASKINLPSQPAFEMPDYSDLSERLSGIETGLGGLQNRFQNLQVPAFDVPEINYDLLAEKISPLDRQFTVEGIPDFASLNERLAGIEQGLSNMPSFEIPD